VSKQSYLERRVEAFIGRHELPPAHAEFRFAPPRLWRFDFAWPDRKLAFEIEGGTFSRGRHTRGLGYEADCEKYAIALLLGWRVLRFTSKQITSGWAFDVLQATLAADDTRLRAVLKTTVGTDAIQPLLLS